MQLATIQPTTSTSRPCRAVQYASVFPEGCGCCVEIRKQVRLVNDASGHWVAGWDDAVYPSAELMLPNPTQVRIYGLTAHTPASVHNESPLATRVWVRGGVAINGRTESGAASYQQTHPPGSTHSLCRRETSRRGAVLASLPPRPMDTTNDGHSPRHLTPSTATRAPARSPHITFLR
uniref:Lipoprotein n=1 Tax=Ascaris lumbricoides TaxID=6252 RepID=A0A0M3HWR2_ASCLU